MTLTKGRKASEPSTPPRGGKADPEQSARFIEGARELGCEENLWRLDEAMRRIAKAKPQPRSATKKGKNEGPS